MTAGRALPIPRLNGMGERRSGRNRGLQIKFIFVFASRSHGNDPFFSGDVEFIIAVETVPGGFAVVVGDDRGFRVPLFVDESVQHLVGGFFLKIRSDEAGVALVFVAVCGLVAEIPVDDRAAVPMAEPDAVEVPEDLSLKFFREVAREVGIRRQRDFRNMQRKTELSELIQNLKLVCRIEKVLYLRFRGTEARCRPVWRRAAAGGPPAGISGNCCVQMRGN